MRNIRNFFLPAVIVVLLLPLFAFWQSSRTDTQVSISSVSPGQGSAGEKATVQYRVNSAAGAFTLIVMPDTQHYSDQYPEIYTTQTQWIRDNKDALNIVFVSHVGDIVQNNDTDESEWLAADAAMRLLDGVVPYSVLPGNHDMQAGGAAKFYEQYFPASRFEKYEWWGGSFDNNRYNYQLFSAGGDDYVILHIQYCPTRAAIEWANEVLAKFPERKAIVTTHSYLGTGAEYVPNCQDKSTGDLNGIQIWNRLIKRNPNVFLVLSGHIPGTARRVDYQDHAVFQLLSDYQDLPLGGSGYLRIMTFEPQEDVIRVSTYSPYLDQSMKDDENTFDLPLEMTGGTPLQGKVLVYSGLKYCIGTVAQGSCELDVSAGDPVKAMYLGDMEYKSSVSAVVPFALP